MWDLEAFQFSYQKQAKAGILISLMCLHLALSQLKMRR